MARVIWSRGLWGEVAITMSLDLGSSVLEKRVAPPKLTDKRNFVDWVNFFYDGGHGIDGKSGKRNGFRIKSGMTVE